MSAGPGPGDPEPETEELGSPLDFPQVSCLHSAHKRGETRGACAGQRAQLCGEVGASPRAPRLHDGTATAWLLAGLGAWGKRRCIPPGRAHACEGIALKWVHIRSLFHGVKGGRLRDWEG